MSIVPTITPAVEAEILTWVSDTFTPASLVLHERLRRCLEEMAELCQSGNLEEKQVHKIVRRVYSRPKGELSQEIGGCGVTLIALCGSRGLNLADIIHVELRRVLNKPVTFFRKKQREKAAAGVSLHVDYDAL